MKTIFYTESQKVIDFIKEYDNHVKAIQCSEFYTANINDEFLSLLKLKFGNHIQTYEEICGDADLSYYYAKDALKHRFPDGEAAIAKDAFYSGYYAIYVIKGRFLRGEEIIKADTSNLYTTIVYEKHFNITL